MSIFHCWLPGDVEEDRAREIEAFDAGDAAEEHVRLLDCGGYFAGEEYGVTRVHVRDSDEELWKVDVVADFSVDFIASKVS